MGQKREMTPMTKKEFVDFLWGRLAADWTYDVVLTDSATASAEKYTASAVRYAGVVVVVNRAEGGRPFTFECRNPHYKAPEREVAFKTGLRNYLKDFDENILIDTIPYKTAGMQPIRYHKMTLCEFADTFCDGKHRTAHFIKDAKTASTEYYISREKVAGVWMALCNSTNGGVLFTHELTDAALPKFSIAFEAYLREQGFKHVMVRWTA